MVSIFFFILLFFWYLLLLLLLKFVCVFTFLLDIIMFVIQRVSIDYALLVATKLAYTYWLDKM